MISINLICDWCEEESGYWFDIPEFDKKIDIREFLNKKNYSLIDDKIYCEKCKDKK